jgi:hypothetical protein
MRGDDVYAAGEEHAAQKRGRVSRRTALQVRGALTLVALIASLAGCGSSNAPGKPPLTLYDDFSSGTLSAAKWSEGQHQTVIDNQAAALSQAISGARRNTAYGTVLSMISPANSVVTTLKVDIQITTNNFTGDTTLRSGIDLWFQPVANRLGPTHLTNALFARISFLASMNGLVVQPQLFECTSDDCSTVSSIGMASGGWPRQGLPFSPATPYTIAISVNQAAKSFTFSISGGAYTPPKMSTIDASAVMTPFPVDLSPSNFYRARLACQIRGGTNGGGDGAVRAQYDNVNVGFNGAVASLFDDFASRTTFDSTKWSVGKEIAQIVDSSLQLALTQKDAPAVVPLNLTDSGVSALQADVTVTQWNLTGQGRLIARLEGALYNDGSNGSGTAPDINRPGSQVGDVLASVSMTGTNVSYLVIRCDTANCSSFTSVQASTTLGSVTLGSAHTLLLWWDPSSHKINFQLDGRPPATFDPVAASHPVVSTPGVPFRQIAVRAGPVNPTDTFTGSITALFDNVKTM